MTPLDFAWAHLGDVLHAPGGIGGECVDLANLWLLESQGGPHVYQNAVDWRNVTIPGYGWVRNGPTNYPSPGDLPIWGQNAAVGTGPNGHIALCMAADANHLLTLDENWPDGYPTRFVLHPYSGVVGWQHKK